MNWETIMKLIVFILSVGFAMALMAAPETSSWTIQGYFDRDPPIGHRNEIVKFKCKLCGWFKVISWDDHFWGNKTENILTRHLEIFHVEDIRKAHTETNVIYCDQLKITQSNVIKGPIIENVTSNGIQSNMVEAISKDMNMIELKTNNNYNLGHAWIIEKHTMTNTLVELGRTNVCIVKHYRLLVWEFENGRWSTSNMFMENIMKFQE